MASRASCGGDAYVPWRGAPYPKSREHWTCDTCAHASREAAEKAMSEYTGLDLRGTMPPPFGKCLGTTGPEFFREALR